MEKNEKYIVYKKLNAKYTFIQFKGKYYLIDFYPLSQIRTYFATAIYDSKIKGWEINKNDIEKLKLKKEGDWSPEAYNRIRALPIILFIIIRFIGLPENDVKLSILYRILIMVLMIVLYSIRLLLINFSKMPVRACKDAEVQITFSENSNMKLARSNTIIMFATIISMFFLIVLLFFVKYVPITMLIISAALVFLLMNGFNSANFPQGRKIEIKEVTN
ncbi:MAG: hypothetical protein LBM02_09625 [Lachnospiraceae bacterium]|jgi:hypothetical protein|nr:hypothetical protein [Lachnospiraceae bacterium]